MGLLDDKWYDPNWGKPHKRRLEAKANHLLKAKKIRRGGRKRKKKKIPRMTYREYMGSAYWKKRKNDYFGAHGKHCAVCSTKVGVTLHHKRYDVHFGAEPDNALVPLCPKHHKEFHNNFELKRGMTKETNEYIFTARQLLNSNIDDLSWIL